MLAFIQTVLQATLANEGTKVLCLSLRVNSDDDIDLVAQPRPEIENVYIRYIFCSLP